MNPELKDKFTTEVCRMENQFLTNIDWGAGIPWRTLSTDLNGNASWRRSQKLYSGGTGIALLLLELGRYHNNKNYTSVAERSILSIVTFCNTNVEQDTFAFITGNIGLVFVIMRFYELTGKDEYRIIALDLAKSYQEFFQTHPPDDFINGTSGALLGLLLLHQASDEAWILKPIEYYVNHLLQKAQLSAQGLYWDRTNRQIRGLCGFSHGAAGIGFVFGELARYFNNEAFYYIAEQAYLYESQHYNPDVGNWQDFRKGIYDDEVQIEHEIRYLSGDKAFFTQGSYMNAWCHGAAGIGLSRLRAFELLGKPVYKTDADNAIQFTIRTDVEPDTISGNFALCHGGGGNADLFIEAYRYTGDEQYLRYAEKVAEKALRQHRELGFYRSGYGLAPADMEDLSLFMGAAGVGYFYLRLLDPHNTPSVLCPTVPGEPYLMTEEEKKQYPMLSISKAELRKHMVKKAFVRTITVIEEINPTIVSVYFEQPIDNRINEMAEWMVFVETLLPSVSGVMGQKLHDVYAIEKTSFLLDTGVESAAYLYIKAQVEVKRGAAFIALPDDEFEQLMVRRDEYLRVVQTSEQSVLLQAHPYGVFEQHISPFAALIFEVFVESLSVTNAIQNLMGQIDYSSQAEAEQIRAAALVQIRTALKAGLLIALPDKEQPAAIQQKVLSTALFERATTTT